MSPPKESLMAEYQPRPRYACDTCQDWRTVVAPDGKGTAPCPDCPAGRAAAAKSQPR